MDVNLRAPFVMINMFKDLLIRSNGCVVNLSCDKGSRPDPNTLGYCMVKAGLDMMTKSTAVELAHFGVRVNSVAPAYIDTNFYRSAGLSEGEIKKLTVTVGNNTPLNRGVGNNARVAQKEEVAKAIIFLTSEEALKITG